MNEYKCESCIYGDLSVDDFPCDVCYMGSMYEPEEAMFRENVRRNQRKDGENYAD